MRLQPYELAKLNGERVTLFHVEANNIAMEYLTWLQNRQVRKFLEVRFEDHTTTSLHDFVKGCNDSPSTLLLGIQRKDTGTYIGNIKLNWDRNHRVGDIGIMIGDIGSWGLGLATDAIKLMTHTALGPLGLRKVVAGVYVGNVGSLRAFQRCGYMLEARLRRHVILDGQETDVLLLSIFHEDVNIRHTPTA